MIPFIFTIRGKKQIIMARSSLEATIKAQRLLESKKMIQITAKINPMTIINTRKMLRGK